MHVCHYTHSKKIIIINKKKMRLSFSPGRANQWNRWVGEKWQRLLHGRATFRPPSARQSKDGEGWDGSQLSLLTKKKRMTDYTLWLIFHKAPAAERIIYSPRWPPQFRMRTYRNTCCTEPRAYLKTSSNMKSLKSLEPGLKRFWCSSESKANIYDQRMVQMRKIKWRILLQTCW